MPTREDPGFRVVRMFHPTIHAPDLAEAERWFARVFGCSSISLASMMKGRPPNPDYPSDYSTFTVVRDVFFDTVDPQRFVLSGIQRYPTVLAPRLKTTGWYVEGTAELVKELRALGIRSMNLLGEIPSGDALPSSPGAGSVTFFLVPEDTGMRYQVMRDGPFPIDPRTAPGWTLPAVAENDPLGIERCSHHTILTSDPRRALALVVDALGGEVVHQGRNDELRANSTFVRIADAVLEYAVPDASTPAHAELGATGPEDCYHAITWRVGDLDRVARHLSAEGVRIRSRSETTIVTAPETSFGIPWGFTTSIEPGR